MTKTGVAAGEAGGSPAVKEVIFSIMRKLENESMRCVTVREVAEALGIRYSSAYNLLRRLENRGLLSKKFIGRVAMYCGDIVELLLNKKRNSKVKALVRLAAMRAILQREGCVSTYTLKMLGVNSREARYTAMRLVEGGEAVSMLIGKTAIWCRSRAEAEALVERLRNTVHRLATANNFRYVTPLRILRVVKNDKEAYSLFSKFIKLSRIDEHFNAVALAFADGVLRLLYGEPMRMRRKTVYTVQPRPEHSIEIIDDVDEYRLYVNLPDDLMLQLLDDYAAALKTTRSAIIRYAIAKMLEKMRKAEEQAVQDVL